MRLHCRGYTGPASLGLSVFSSEAQSLRLWLVARCLCPSTCLLFGRTRWAHQTEVGCRSLPRALVMLASKPWLGASDVQAGRNWSGSLLARYCPGEWSRWFLVALVNRKDNVLGTVFGVSSDNRWRRSPTDETELQSSHEGPDLPEIDSTATGQAPVLVCSWWADFSFGSAVLKMDLKGLDWA